jgi:hypothetical protein
MRRALALALVLAVLFAAPAHAGSASDRHGACDGGPGRWRLRVQREDADTLRIRFRIEDVAPGQSWQLFISDNGTRIYSATRSSGSQGEIRVNKQTRDRNGRDHIAANAVNSATGSTCEGSVSI